MPVAALCSLDTERSALAVPLLYYLGPRCGPPCTRPARYAPQQPVQNKKCGRAALFRQTSACELALRSTGPLTRSRCHNAAFPSFVSAVVGAIGLEPTTPTMSRWCSNQLS